MEKSIWKKEQYEVRNEELLAYTLANIAPFEWVTITMYISDNIYTHPPIFCWRFSCEDEKIYARLKECIIKFEENHKWEMYKGSDIGGHTKKTTQLSQGYSMKSTKATVLESWQKYLEVNIVKYVLKRLRTFQYCVSILNSFFAYHIQNHYSQYYRL